MAVQNLSTTQKVTYTIRPKTASGKPARLDGVPEWASSDSSIIDVAPAADGLSAVVSSRGAGIAQVSVTGDADLGAGSRPIIGVGDVVVTPPAEEEATIVEFEIGTPEEQG
jgi:hypothetical protein